MKYLYILIIAIAFVSCTPQGYFNENQNFIVKGMNIDQVNEVLKEEPHSIRKIKVNDKEYKIFYYQYIVSTMVKKSSASSSNLLAGQVVRTNSTVSETSTDKDTFILTMDENGELFYWGMNYDYLRSDDPLINDIGSKAGTLRSTTKDTDVY